MEDSQFNSWILKKMNFWNDISFFYIWVFWFLNQGDNSDIITCGEIFITSLI